MNAKRSQFDGVIAETEKEYGAEVISRGARQGPIEVISSRILSVDLALGCGGFPRGRICEIFGPSGSAKTSLLLSTMAEAQSMQLEVMYVDAEFALLPEWAHAHGVDMEKIILVQPQYGEQALNIVENFALKGMGLIVVDSVEGLVPRAEIDGEMEDNQMGIRARMIGKALRKLMQPVSRSGCSLLFVNQVRSKIGVVYGNPETTGGGQSLEFASSIRVRVSRKEFIKEGEMKVGIRTQIETVKNKVAAAFQKAEFDVYGGSCACHSKGIDVFGDLLDVGVERGVIEKAGSWLSFTGEKIGQGRIASCDRLKAEPKLAEGIRFEILKITNKGAAE